MLLLHAYPHNHCECDFKITPRGSAQLVKVDFELPEPAREVNIQFWSNIDDTWRGYDMPYIIQSRGLNSRLRPTMEWCEQNHRIFDVKVLDHNRAFGFQQHSRCGEMYRAYGYITFQTNMIDRAPIVVVNPRRTSEPPTPTRLKREATFRGRYQRHNGEWSDWFWIGTAQKFGFEKNVAISLVYERVMSVTKLQDVCADCAAPCSDAAARRAFRLVWFICHLCRREISRGVSLASSEYLVGAHGSL